MADRKVVRIWMKDGSYKSFSCTPEMTVQDLVSKIADRMGIEKVFAERFTLIERKGKEDPRMLQSDDSPYEIKSQWEEEGYNVESGYYKLVFRMKTDSELQESKRLENRYMLRAGANVLEAPEVARAAQQIELIEKAEKGENLEAIGGGAEHDEHEEKENEEEVDAIDLTKMWDVVKRLETIAVS